MVEARALVTQIARAQFALGDKALEIEPMRPVGGSVAKGTEELFTVEEALQMSADDIGVALSTVEDWRWVSSRWLADKRKDGMSFTVRKILASITDEAERWVSIEDAPFNPRNNRKQWTTDGVKRPVGQQVDRPVTVEEKVRAVRDLTRGDEVAAAVTATLLSRPETAAALPAAERGRVVAELTRDDDIATKVTAGLLQRPRVGREAMRNDDVRFTVNRAQFDNPRRAGPHRLSRETRSPPWGALASGCGRRRRGSCSTIPPHGRTRCRASTWKTPTRRTSAPASPPGAGRRVDPRTSKTWAPEGHWSCHSALVAGVAGQGSESAAGGQRLLVDPRSQEVGRAPAPWTTTAAAKMVTARKNPEGRLAGGLLVALRCPWSPSGTGPSRLASWCCGRRRPDRAGRASGPRRTSRRAVFHGPCRCPSLLSCSR
ncbi:DUF6192 family protein [Streptomyces sp. NPDC056519]|uniref:DUF6192 family protein n=1 Tax=Streptomyces sp. NPDC056519 TaxID=3345849 RepID=UPI0036AE63EF